MYPYPESRVPQLYLSEGPLSDKFSCKQDERTRLTPTLSTTIVSPTPPETNDRRMEFGTMTNLLGLSIGNPVLPHVKVRFLINCSLTVITLNLTNGSFS